MRPRADEVMQSIIWTYDEHILPNVQGAFPKSLALTVSNLLRHVALRLEHEAPAMIEDIAELREVLGDIHRYTAALPAVPESLQRLQAELDAARQPAPVTGYVSPLDLVETATQLRGLLDRALKALQQHRATLGAAPEYKAVRERIRTYLNHHLQRESLWIGEAFTKERR